MRNLSIQSERKRLLLLRGSADASNSTSNYNNSNNSTIVDICSLYNNNNNDNTSSSARVVVLTTDGDVIAINDNDDEIIWQTNLNSTIDESNNNNNDSCWFNMTIIQEHNMIVCLNRNGAIVNVVDGQTELVGEFENGIYAAAWSLDYETLALITSAEDDIDPNITKTVLLTMNTQFDVLAEVTIEKITDINNVSICWSSNNNNNQLVAINSVDSTDDIRKIRIYKGDTLELHAIGRNEDGSGKLITNITGSNITWANSNCSNLLACIQQKGKKIQQIAFIESNGLRHREFTLREDFSTNITVLGIQFNIQSDILAITIKDNNIYKVQLWYRSNYYWYMKYELQYKQEQISNIKFHEEDPYLLYIMFENTLCWIEYKLRWDVSTIMTSTTTSKKTLLLLAYSIDGCNINITNYEKCFIPPPMYEQTLIMKYPVCQIIAARIPAKEGCGPINSTIVSLSNGDLVILNHNNNEGSVPSIGATFHWSDTKGFDAVSFHHTVVLEYTTGSIIRLLTIGSSWDKPGKDYLINITLSMNDSGESTGVATVESSIQLENRCLTMSRWLDSKDGVLLQLDDGTLLEYNMSSGVDDFVLTPSPCEQLMEPCPWIVALKNAAEYVDAKHQHRQRLVIGMSSSSRLFCHDILLSDSISSFNLSLENKFLCYVTAGSRCVLRFLPLIDLYNFDPLSGSDENHLLIEGYEPRNVERGARLVAVLSKKPTIVLQMPRGNIEIIYPRALVLRHVMLGVKEFQYKETFELMRRQKVDLNLLVDMDPYHFLEQDGIIQFVEQILPIDHLNLFISCLQNWDLTMERYKIPHWIQSKTDDVAHQNFDFSDKVNKVCRKMREVMIAAEQNGKTQGGRVVNESHFLLPILSTFAKENPPKLHSALDLIKENALRKHGTNTRKPPLFSESAQSSIQYLAFLADYELLFNTALESYDYDMARAVARNSQMDPKVYLPVLKRFKDLPLYYGRYEVDIKLKRYELALKNLSQSRSLEEKASNAGVELTLRNDFDACMKLIEEHQLYYLGLELFGDNEMRNRIMIALSDHLLESRQEEAALCALLSMDPIDKERCIQAAKASKNWKVLFSLVEEKDYPSLAVETAEALVSIAETSVDRYKLFSDAARILLDYGKDVPGSVDMLIRAEAWEEGKRIAHIHNMEDLTRKVISAAVSYAYTTIEDFTDRAEAFITASNRYSEVLKIRKEAIKSGEFNFDDPGAGDNHDDSGSLFSAASNASNLSTTSTSSTGSVGSLSSVISVKSTTSFTLTSSEDTFRHKSKYNQLGRNINEKKKKKKKKKKGRSKTKIRPGSEEELQSLVETMKTNCIDQQYCNKICETIIFLIHNKQLNVARILYDNYKKLYERIMNEQTTRSETSTKEEHERIIKARRDGFNNAVIETTIRHPVEAEVDGLKCCNLSTTVEQVFKFLPAV